jgi:hypothetical protein
MSMRQSRPRAAKTAAMKKIAAIIADENASIADDPSTRTYQFPFTPFPNETHEETMARLTAQLRYYKKHPIIVKNHRKNTIKTLFSYLKKLFK